MADYKQLYFLLFQEISAAIDTLQEAQAKAEELVAVTPNSLGKPSRAGASAA